MSNFADHDVVLGDDVYTITPIPAIKGLTFMRRITKLLGPSITAMFAEATESGEDKDASEVNMDGIQRAVDLLVLKMDSPEVETLILDLMKTVNKNGQPLNFNLEFTANYGRLFKLLIEVGTVNFSSLFPQRDTE